MAALTAETPKPITQRLLLAVEFDAGPIFTGAAAPIARRRSKFGEVPLVLRLWT
ncbi:hypothetical protein MMMDOFMJ_0330 [Methylobacterium gnaphalii]|nr:hypothetical protein MMMDOFMJ_0330 [Methylobacterium gnaphalii]